MSNDDISQDDDIPAEPGKASDFSAPLGKLQSGCLVFASGASHVSLKAGRVAQDLYRARFRGDIPSVKLRDNALIVQFQRILLHAPFVHLHEPMAEIIVNRTIPWEIEFRGGVSMLNAELDALELKSLDILGGANRIELTLAAAAGTTFIYISGGILNSAINRPVGVGLRVKISDGVNDLAFDSRHLAAVGGEISLESPDFDRAASRYDICIAGGASKVAIGHGEATGLRR